ncbi:MAG: ATP-binding protein, partial [Candidatus Cloacimonetes bacterium]|nr:ATP-binding protein [Candidatus Cloacimonadota bacterium]
PVFSILSIINSVVKVNCISASAPIIISTHFSKKNIRQALFPLITIYILYYEKLAKVDFCIMQQVPIVTAILDRLMHHCEAIILNGDSYRLKDK